MVKCIELRQSQTSRLSISSNSFSPSHRENTAGHNKYKFKVLKQIKCFLQN